MFFHLGFDFAEGFFAARANMSILCGGVKCAGRQGQIQRERVFVFARNFRKYGMELHQIRLVALQKRVQLTDCVFHLLLDGIVILEIFETDREFHVRTYRMKKE